MTRTFGDRLLVRFSVIKLLGYVLRRYSVFNDPSEKTIF